MFLMSAGISRLQLRALRSASDFCGQLSYIAVGKEGHGWALVLLLSPEPGSGEGLAETWPIEMTSRSEASPASGTDYYSSGLGLFRVGAQSGPTPSLGRPTRPKTGRCVHQVTSSLPEQR